MSFINKLEKKYIGYPLLSVREEVFIDDKIELYIKKFPYRLELFELKILKNVTSKGEFIILYKHFNKVFESYMGRFLKKYENKDQRLNFYLYRNNINQQTKEEYIDYFFKEYIQHLTSGIEFYDVNTQILQENKAIDINDYTIKIKTIEVNASLDYFLNRSSNQNLYGIKNNVLEDYLLFCDKIIYMEPVLGNNWNLKLGFSLMDRITSEDYYKFEKKFDPHSITIFINNIMEKIFGESLAIRDIVGKFFHKGYRIHKDTSIQNETYYSHGVYETSIISTIFNGNYFDGGVLMHELGHLIHHEYITQSNKYLDCFIYKYHEEIISHFFEALYRIELSKKYPNSEVKKIAKDYYGGLIILGCTKHQLQQNLINIFKRQQWLSPDEIEYEFQKTLGLWVGNKKRCWICDKELNLFFDKISHTLGGIIGVSLAQQLSEGNISLKQIEEFMKVGYTDSIEKELKKYLNFDLGSAIKEFKKFWLNLN